MPTYITLMKWTDQGIRDLKESPQRLDAGKKVVEAAGGKMIGFYLTMGRYDLVAVYESPSDEAATTTILSIASRGSIRSETMRAFPEDEYREIIAKTQ